MIDPKHVIPEDLGAYGRKNYEFEYAELLKDHEQGIRVRSETWGVLRFWRTEIYGHDPKRKVVSMPIWLAEREGIVE